MPVAVKAAGGNRRGGAEEEAIIQVMDYKTEMCQMIDNIKDVEVFRCIDIDMSENTTQTMQITQIQRLMKVKTELQSATPEIREVQLTLKRFIVDLDIKEAYEFSVLNPFLINEEELNNILTQVGGGQSESALHKGGGLELHNQGSLESDEEEERKSLGAESEDDEDYS